LIDNSWLGFWIDLAIESVGAKATVASKVAAASEIDD